MKRYAIYTVSSGHIDQICVHFNAADVAAICGPGQALLEMPDGIFDTTHRVVDGQFVEL